MHVRLGVAVTNNIPLALSIFIMFASLLRALFQLSVRFYRKKPEAKTNGLTVDLAFRKLAYGKMN